MFAVAANNVPVGLVDFFHGLQAAIMLTVMLNVVQFAWWTVKRDKKKMSHCSRFGAVYLLLVSTVLVCTQPFCMLVISSWKFDNWFFDGGDFGVVCTLGSECGSGSCVSPSFSCDDIKGSCVGLMCGDDGAAGPCTCGLDSGALVPNTTLGWIIQVFGTYLGFILLFIGVFSATKLHIKLKNKWNELRGSKGGDMEAPAPKYRAPMVNAVAANPANDEEEECTT